MSLLCWGIGWVQILLYCAILVAITPVLTILFLVRERGDRKPSQTPLLRSLHGLGKRFYEFLGAVGLFGGGFVAAGSGPPVSAWSEPVPVMARASRGAAAANNRAASAAAAIRVDCRRGMGVTAGQAGRMKPLKVAAGVQAFGFVVVVDDAPVVVAVAAAPLVQSTASVRVWPAEKTRGDTKW